MAQWIASWNPDRARFYPWPGHCVVLRKTLYSHGASIHPGVKRSPANLMFRRYGSIGLTQTYALPCISDRERLYIERSLGEKDRTLSLD